MPDGTQSSCFLLALPTEIQLMILRALPDVPTLRALILTNSQLYQCFISQASSISLEVLSNEIPYTVLPEAIVAWNSSKIEPWSMSRVKGILYDYHALRNRDEAQPIIPLCQSWTFPDALEVSELYQCCRFFASDMLTSILLSMDSVFGFPTSDYPYLPSSREARRLERTFLRFELYCNLFRKRYALTRGYTPPQFSGTEQHDIYFRHYAAWENEQLACVHDYLFRQLSIPFNDFALHDVQWGKHRVRIISTYGYPPNFWKEHFLSLGLVFLRRFVAAKTYEQRGQLLDANLDTNELFFYQGCIAQAEFLFMLSAEERRKAINQQFFHDDDEGPEKAWRWAYDNQVMCFLYFEFDFYDLRAWGFCLWDHARLLNWGVFDKACIDRPSSIYTDCVLAGRKSDEELSKSWQERSRIWDQGGRGWWEDGDDSKIVWGSSQTNDEK